MLTPLSRYRAITRGTPTPPYQESSKLFCLVWSDCSYLFRPLPLGEVFKCRQDQPGGTVYRTQRTFWLQVCYWLYLPHDWQTMIHRPNWLTARQILPFPFLYILSVAAAAAELSCGTEPVAYKPKIFILWPFAEKNSDDTSSSFLFSRYITFAWLPCFHPDSTVPSPNLHEILAYVLSRISSLALPPLVWTLLVMAFVLTKHPIAVKLFNLFCLYSLNPRKSFVPAFGRQIELCKHVSSTRTVWSTRSNREWEAAHLQQMRFGGRISGEVIWTNCPVPQSSG